MSSLASLRIGILGLGQIGGSMATCLSRTSSTSQVIGYDIRPELVQTALEAKVIATDASSVIGLIENSEIVVLALPVGETLSTLREHANALAGKVAITDTGSVKAEIVAAAREVGLTNFVGGHPLTGTEKRGAESWDGALFEGATYFLTSKGQTESGATEVISLLVDALQAKPSLVNPEQHDRIFAVTSNLPHLLAFCLERTLDDFAAPGLDTELFRGPSFRGATRVAKSDPEMVFEMLWHNRANLSESVGLLIERLTNAKGVLDSSDEVKFRQILHEELHDLKGD